MLARLEIMLLILLWPCRAIVRGVVLLIPLLLVGAFLKQGWMVEAVIWLIYGFVIWGISVIAIYVLMVLFGHREGGL